MIITKLEYQKKDPNRVNVYVDDEYSFSLSVSQIAGSNIRQGSEIDDESISKYISEDLKIRVMNKALDYLSRGMKSNYQVERTLRTYIKKLGTDGSKYQESSERLGEQIISEVLEELTEKELLNDERYAEEYIRSVRTKKKVSNNYLRNKLYEKGVDREIVEKVLDDDQFRVDEVLEIDQILERKFGKKRVKFTDQKIIRHLQGKGFEWDNISKFIDR